MRFETESVDDILVISPPSAELDAGNAEEFKKDVMPMLEGHDKVVINMQPITFMDSAGMGAVLSVYKKVMAQHGQFRIYGLTKEVKALFELVRMHRLFEIHEDREAALMSMKL